MKRSLHQQFYLDVRDLKSARSIQNNRATQPTFSAEKLQRIRVSVQRRAGLQQIKTAAVESFGIPQASRVAATLGTFRVRGR
jgi:hypothetical protein